MSTSSGPTKSPTESGKPTPGMTPLAASFQPSDRDVICARGKTARDHPGNVWFRALIESHMEEYAQCETKLDKSFLVSNIIKLVRREAPEGGFVKNFADGTWYEVGDRLSREKIGQTFRDMLHTQYRSSTKAKAVIRRQRASATADSTTLPKAAPKNTKKTAQSPTPPSSNDSEASRADKTNNMAGEVFQASVSSGNHHPHRTEARPAPQNPLTHSYIGHQRAVPSNNQVFSRLPNLKQYSTAQPLPTLHARKSTCAQASSSAGAPTSLLPHQLERKHPRPQRMILDSQSSQRQPQPQQQLPAAGKDSCLVFRGDSLNHVDNNNAIDNRRSCLGLAFNENPLGADDEQEELVEPQSGAVEVRPESVLFGSAAIHEMYQAQLFDSEQTMSSLESQSQVNLPQQPSSSQDMTDGQNSHQNLKRSR